MITSFSRLLLEWYNPDLRQLPSNKTSDPYKIWLSEIILQQTRVEQGKPYYKTFVEKFPTVRDLARAPLDDVLKTWEGLGYYSRARNLHTAAKQVMTQFDGVFPKDHQSILSLKGVGDYTAAAIASFAFGLPYAVIDGNVYRLLSRICGIDLPIDSTIGKAKFKDLADKLLDKENPGLYNQAIMDFGSMVCKPANPLCDKCPFEPDCKAKIEGRISQLPVKSKKPDKKTRYFHFWVIRDDKHIYIQQRHEKDIWKGLNQFPLIEFNGRKDWEQKVKNIPFGVDVIGFDRVDKTYRQILTHQEILAKFFVFKMMKPVHLNGFPAEKMSIKDMNKLAFPKIIRQFLQEQEFLVS